ncbi:MAG TPA: hypothetical protein IAB10_05605 [Candidatus Avilachnospira avistercoris]|nr:hypothetical protein [Candidatus Avilachnospira avistercoris]
MLFKLIKYEWRAMMRSLLPVYIAALALSVIIGLGSELDIFTRLSAMPGLGFLEVVLTLLQVVLVIAYVVIIVALFVISTIVSVQRFYKGLLRDEGYLMFTLPVKVWELTLSKAIVSFLAGFISIIVAIFAIGLLSAVDLFEFILAIFQIPGQLIGAVNEALLRGTITPADLTNLTIFAIEFILMAIISAFAGIYQFYAAMALGQMSRKHKVLFSVLWYIGINIIASIVFYAALFLGAGTVSIMGAFATAHPMIAVHMVVGAMFIYCVINLAAFILVTNVVLKQRLNLE